MKYREIWHFLLQKLLGLNLLLPANWVAWAAESFLGARLCAYFTGLLPANRSADVAYHLSSPFLAELCQQLDDAHVGEIISLMPPAHIRRVSNELFRRQDYRTIARLSKSISATGLSAALEDIEDGEALLRIGLLVEEKRLADFLPSMLPRQIRAIVQAAVNPEAGLWPSALILIAAIPPGWQRQFIAAAADGEEEALINIINAVIKFDSWQTALPLFSKMSAVNQQRLVNVISRQDDHVLRAILAATEQHDLWDYLLPFLGLMDANSLRAWAKISDEIGDAALERILTVVHEKDLWSILLPLTKDMSRVRRGTIAEFIGISADAELNSLIEVVNAEGSWHMLIPFLGLMSDEARCRIANWPALLTEQSLRLVFQATQEHELWDILLPMMTLVQPMNMVKVTRVAEKMEDGAILSRIMAATSPFSRRAR